MAINTVENFLDIPIDYFISIGMEGFKDMIDVFGGVTVQNDFSFEQSGEYYEEGELHLEGERALHYARMRKSDPEGDLGRNARQQEVINELISEGASLSSLTRVNNMLDVVGNNLRTNLNFDQMRTLLEDYRGVRHNREQFVIKGEDQYIDGVYYYTVSDEERDRISNKVRDHLQMKHN